jgi:hypothetical protein
LGTFAEIVTEHLKRYPEMQIVDLYKLAFQAAMGNGHLIKNPENSLERLNKEIAQIKSDGSESLVEKIDPNKKLVRVNLKTFKFLGKNPVQLNNAIVETSKNYAYSIYHLKLYWIQIPESPECKFSKSVLNTFFVKMEENHFPAQHHSEKYRELYNPAYRIIDVQYLDWI